MRKDSILVFIVLILVLYFMMLPAYGKEAGFSILRFPSSGRAVGLGEAYVAVPGELNNMNYNPAGLAFLEVGEFTFMHSAWLADLSYQYVSYGNYLEGIGNVGINLKYLGIPKFEYVDANGEIGDKISCSELAITGGLGKDFSFAYAGLNLKYISVSYEDYSFTALGVDIGLLKELGLLKPRKTYIGISARNLGAMLSKDENADSITMPMDIAIGIGAEAVNSLLCSGDVVFDRDFAMAINIGAEYALTEFLSLRASYKIAKDSAAGLGAGFGIGKTIETFLGTVDYAFADYGDFGYNHHISVSLKSKAAKKPRKKSVEKKEEEMTELELLKKQLEEMQKKMDKKEEEEEIMDLEEKKEETEELEEKEEEIIDLEEKKEETEELEEKEEEPQPEDTTEDAGEEAELEEEPIELE